MADGAEQVDRGALLRELRERSGVSQVEAAARIGIPASVLSAYERGRREPRVDVFFRAAEALGFGIDFTLQPAALDLTVLDMAEKEAILLQVCALAMAMPRREPGELQFPPFHTLAVGSEEVR